MTKKESQTTQSPEKEENVNKSLKIVNFTLQKTKTGKPVFRAVDTNVSNDSYHLRLRVSTDMHEWIVNTLKIGKTVFAKPNGNSDTGFSIVVR